MTPSQIELAIAGNEKRRRAIERELRTTSSSAAHERVMDAEERIEELEQELREARAELREAEEAFQAAEFDDSRAAELAHELTELEDEHRRLKQYERDRFGVSFEPA
jgi:capsule polysaccharide export protein KpsE/RkpR